MSWIKKARGLKRVTTKQLGEMCGKSQIYIQKIEAGDKDLPQQTAENIYSALGFTPTEVPFKTKELLEEVDMLNSKYGDDSLCGLSYVLIDDVVYFNDVIHCKAFESSYQALITTVRMARILLGSQLVLFG